MKKLFKCILYILNLSLFAQQTYIPDDNFEQALIDKGYDDVLDDYVDTSNIISLKTLYISNENISDLTGIEDLESLESLECSNNNLTSLDVSLNTSLTYLVCNVNSITDLDLSNNINLTYLELFNNNLTGLDLSNNINLTYLELSNNSLTSLDLSNNPDIEYLSCSNMPNLTSLNFRNYNNGFDDGHYNTYFYVTNTPNLSCIQVDDADVSTQKMSSNIDNHVSFSEDCGFTSVVDTATPTKDNYTYVPDTKFEQFLIAQGYDDKLDNFVLTANISSVERLYMVNNYISDLRGIEDFTGLKTLSVGGNPLVFFDISKNTELNYLECGECNLNNLDISNNKSLSGLYCSNNNLTSLDVSLHTSLTYLDCSVNSITNLDLSKNVSLTYLELHQNNLTSLDLSKNVSLTYLELFDNNWTNLDLSNNVNLTYLELSNNSLTSLDLSNNPDIDYLSCSNMESLTSLNLKNSNINVYNAVVIVNNTPNLDCIQVYDAALSTDQWSDDVDSHIGFSENCDSTLSEENIILHEDFDFKIHENKVYYQGNFKVFNFLGQEIPNENLKGVYIIEFHNNYGSVRKTKLFIP